MKRSYIPRKGQAYGIFPFYVSSHHGGRAFRSAQSSHKPPYPVQVLIRLVLESAKFDCENRFQLLTIYESKDAVQP